MIHNSIHSATAILGFVLTASSLPLRAELKSEDLYLAVLPSIVTLEVENVAGRRFVGSAFLAVGDCLAVTAWHVVQDARRVEARFSDNQRVNVVGLVDVDEKHDVALVKLEGGARPRITLNSATPRIGSRIYVVGSPRGFDFSISEGLLSQVRTLEGVRYYQVSCPISPGDSGGPVLNERGEAIGVMSWRKADAENVSFAIPGADVTRLNAARAPAAWPSGATSSHTSGNQSVVHPSVRAAVPANSETNTDGFSDFQHFLGDHAGKRLKVVVREGGKQSQFIFEVPKEQAR